MRDTLASETCITFRSQLLETMLRLQGDRAELRDILMVQLESCTDQALLRQTVNNLLEHWPETRVQVRDILLEKWDSLQHCEDACVRLARPLSEHFVDDEDVVGPLVAKQLLDDRAGKWIQIRGPAVRLHRWHTSQTKELNGVHRARFRICDAVRSKMESSRDDRSAQAAVLYADREVVRRGLDPALLPSDYFHDDARLDYAYHCLTVNYRAVRFFDKVDWQALGFGAPQAGKSGE
jgi:hypothetical protein